MFCAVSSAKSPRMVPGAASCGRVAPLMARTTAIAFGPVEGSRDERRRGDELDQAGEERLAAVGGVVTLGEIAIDLHELEPEEPETTILVAGEDPADQLALDAVGLDEDERAFNTWHVYLGVRVVVARDPARGTGGIVSDTAGGSDAGAALRRRSRAPDHAAIA